MRKPGQISWKLELDGILEICDVKSTPGRDKLNDSHWINNHQKLVFFAANTGLGADSFERPNAECLKEPLLNCNSSELRPTRYDKAKGAEKDKKLEDQLDA